MRFFSTLLLLGFSISAQAMTIEQIRAQYFSGAPRAKACAIYSKNSNADLAQLDAGLQKLVTEFKEGLVQRKAEKFRDLFHPRIKSTRTMGERIIAALNETYQEPWDVSFARIWLLNNEGSDKAPLRCAEDHLDLTPVFGFDLQMGIWLQVTGQNELARLYLAVVPSSAGWRIAGLHIQQWTFRGKDHEAWIQEGMASGAQPILKHIYLDIAQKLLFGGEFISYELTSKILEERDLALTKEAWREKASASLPGRDVIYLGTALASDGPGILVRLRVPKALSMDDIRDQCLKVGTTFVKAGWLSAKSGGLKCEFVLPNENSDREGILGSQFIERKEIPAA